MLAAKRRRALAVPARGVDHHRHPQTALEVHDPFQHQTVVAHHVAVVAGEDDDRVVGCSEPVERREDPPDAVVDRLDHPVGGGDRCTGQLGRRPERDHVLAVAALARVETADQAEVRRPNRRRDRRTSTGSSMSAGSWSTEPRLGR